MQHSKIQTFSALQSLINLEDELPHHNCTCYHCFNNTKPISKPIAPRIISSKEKHMTSAKAYQFSVKQMAKGYVGKCQVPDVFLIGEAELIFQSRSQGRPRLRENMTHIEVKKHFEEQKKRVPLGSLASQFLVSSIFMIPEESGSLGNALGKPQREREIAILTYNDGTEQLMTEALLSKTLEKRKNDPSWQAISHLILIPPQLKHPFTKIRYRYIRSEDTIPELLPKLDKIAMQMDGVDQRTFVVSSTARNQSKLSFLKLEEQQQMQSSIPNPERSLVSSTIRKTRSMIVPKKASSMTYEQINDDFIKQISLQLIAYIQVTTLMRILQGDFQFFNDGSKVYLSNICNFIYQELEGSQLTLIHDRYKPLEEISLKEIALRKEQYDKLEAKQVQNICAALVKEALQFRKVELKLDNYKNPSRETLQKIFMKIFPDFKVEDIFGSVNWKNQLGSFIADRRNKINKIIREDQGIRILRRFGIEFRRTFH